MLAMAQQKHIRNMRNLEGCSISQIAKRMRINWRTAKKYADEEDYNLQIKRPGRVRPVMGPYVEIIDAWLLEDFNRPKKQRHTARRIYDRLVAEHGFKGSDRTVRAYVAKRRKELKLEGQEAHNRLEHPGGEAQVDFGTIDAWIGGELVELKLLVMSFPYSNAAYAYAVLAENTECFLEGLKQLFTKVGGVPRRIWFDNLSAAVVRKKGSLSLTESFERFCLHYGFEAVFCNPRAGHEKGHVENKVGYSRRNWCVPLPEVAELAELQEHLYHQAEADLKRMHYRQNRLQEDLWEEERTKLQRLPVKPFEVFSIETAKVNKYGEVVARKECLRIPGAIPGTSVFLKYTWNSITALDQDLNPIAVLPRSYIKVKATEPDWETELGVFRNKARPLLYSQVYKRLPAIVQEYLTSGEIRPRLRWLLRMLKSYSMQDIAKVLETYPFGTDPVLLEHALYQLSKPKATTLAEDYTPREVQEYEPDISAYDQLAKGVEK